MTQKPKTQDSESAGKVLAVLRVLERNFYHGFSPTELSKETGLTPSAITRYVATLQNAGYAERIHETGRIRISHRMAQVAVQVLNSLEHAQNHAQEVHSRLTRI